MNTCPQCGSSVSYVGTFNIECAGRECPNYREQEIKTGDGPLYGTAAWACLMQERGWRLEWRVVGNDWNKLQNPLRPDVKYSDDCRFRLNQEYYGLTDAPMPRGSREWAEFHIKHKVSVGFDGDEWVIVPD